MALQGNPAIPRTSEPTLLFLFPLVYRPEKANFAPRFERLSSYANGAIFALSGIRRRGDTLGRFTLFTAPSPDNAVLRLLRALRVQIWEPLRQYRRNQVDAVISYDPFRSGFCGVIVKWILGARLIIEVNGDYHETRTGNRLKDWLMTRTLRFTLGRADAIKVVNSSQERYFRERYPAKPIFCFLDYVAEQYFASLTSEPGDYLLTVGSPFHFKGVGDLIQAFHLIAGKHPNLRLRIMGWCPPGELEAFQQLANHDPRICFVPAGWVEDVGEEMRKCYALVNASHFEAGARVLFEAMACRKPVVATRTNGSRDHIRDGETGFLCGIRDVPDLAAKLDRLVASPERARTMGEAAYQYVQQACSESRYFEQYRSLLETIGVACTQMVADIGAS